MNNRIWLPWHPTNLVNCKMVGVDKGVNKNKITPPRILGRTLFWLLILGFCHMSDRNGEDLVMMFASTPLPCTKNAEQQSLRSVPELRVNSVAQLVILAK
jgi:hypothetical protein